MQPKSPLGSTLWRLIIFFSCSVYVPPASAKAALDRPNTTQMLIDIKPRDFPNGINPRGHGVIPVAILTNTDFAAHTVDPHTVRFGKHGTEAIAIQFAMVDVDGDGDLDLLLHFKIQDTKIQCGDTSASFTAQTSCGQTIGGSDSVVPVGCK
jgi:hypothetical protein